MCITDTQMGLRRMKTKLSPAKFPLDAVESAFASREEGYDSTQAPVCECGHSLSDHVNGYGKARDCGAEVEHDFCACAWYRPADATVAP